MKMLHGMHLTCLACCDFPEGFLVHPRNNNISSVSSSPTSSEYEFKSLRPRLKKVGWKYKKNPLKSNYYAAPNKDHKNGIENVDYFFTPEEVVIFFSQKEREKQGVVNESSSKYSCLKKPQTSTQE